MRLRENQTYKPTTLFFKFQNWVGKKLDKECRDRGLGRGEGEGGGRASEFPTVDACFLGVTLVNNLLPILQLACMFRMLQTMKTAGFVQPNCQSLLCCRWWKYQLSEPWVDISIWISSAQLNHHSRPPTDNSCNIHSHYEAAEPSLCGARLLAVIHRQHQAP